MNRQFQLLLVTFFLISTVPAWAASTIRFQFEEQDLAKIVKAYAKASGQQFVFESPLKGKATILAREKVSLPKAFELLSSALARNGWAISQQNDLKVILRARNIQRSMLPVHTKLPPLKPERVITYVKQLDAIEAPNVLRKVRMLPSRNGEVTSAPGNKIVLTDWVSNVYRVDQLLQELDRPPKSAKK